MDATTYKQTAGTTISSPPIWFWIAAATGLAWNAYGVYQFIGTVSATPASMMAMGMTEDQAALYTSLPGWMTAAFAVGVFGGLLGSACLLLRRKLATTVLAVSLAGYVVLYVGDIVEGVFAALGFPQVAVLTTVVVIAVGLLWLSRSFQNSSHLT